MNNGFGFQAKHNEIYKRTWVSNLFNKRKKNKPFRLENASSLTHEFLYYNFNKKILLSFLGKIVMFKI